MVWSAKVVISPISSAHPSTDFLKILLIILPDLVLGSPFTNYMKSIWATGPIFSLTYKHNFFSKSRLISTP